MKKQPKLVTVKTMTPAGTLTPKMKDVVNFTMEAVEEMTIDLWMNVPVWNDVKNLRSPRDQPSLNHSKMSTVSYHKRRDHVEQLKQDTTIMLMKELVMHLLMEDVMEIKIISKQKTNAKANVVTYKTLARYHQLKVHVKAMKLVGTMIAEQTIVLNFTTVDVGVIKTTFTQKMNVGVVVSKDRQKYQNCRVQISIR